MTDYERTKIDMELRDFFLRNFEKPANCKNPEQIRYYVKELALKIEAIEREFNYVPDWAYSLLAQYNAVQNTMVHQEFRNAYSPQDGLHPY